MLKTLLSLLLISLFLVNPAIAQLPETKINNVNLTNDNRVKWLNKNALKVRSINPVDEDFSDLMPLKRAIGDTQVVMLGEASHQDAGIYLAKGRLIKFLHEKMGFDVLTFESGFYDVNRAWENLQAGKEAEKAILHNVAFSGFEEFKPIIEYIGEQSKTKKPLAIAGIDSQLTGAATRYTLVSDLRDFFKEVGVQTNALDEDSSFSKQIVLMGLVGLYTPPDQAFIDTLADLRKQVAAKTTKLQSPKVAFGIQLLESIDAHIRMLQLHEEYKRRTDLPAKERNWFPMKASQIRNKQMADNLLWLMRVRYPNKKIIVSAASSHLAYSDIYIKDPFFKKKWRDEEHFETGYWIHKALGSKAYSIGFTAYEGKAGTITITNDPKRIWAIESNQRPEIELEELFHATKMEYAFVDLRNPRKGGEWLKEPIAARPMGHQALEGRWDTVLDGIFYIRQMKPCTWRKDIAEFPFIKMPSS